jgi:2,3-bisphosphoglycerate-independent phosphoglycerate mutase
LVVTSDHGNLEDLTTSNHTRNPVPLLAIGPIAAPMARAESITDVMGLLLNF